MSTAAPNLDDVGIDAHHLAQLLDTLVETLMNMTYPATRDDLTRAAALANIARDMSVTMVRDFDAAHHDALTELGKAKQARTAA